VALKKRLHPARQAGLANRKLSRLNLRSRVASAAPSSMKRKVARWVTARMLLEAGGARPQEGMRLCAITGSMTMAIAK
jgi:hypothetical protein